MRLLIGDSWLGNWRGLHLYQTTERPFLVEVRPQRLTLSPGSSLCAGKKTNIYMYMI